MELPLDCICEELLAENMRLENIEQMKSKHRPGKSLQHIVIDGILELENLLKVRKLQGFIIPVDGFITPSPWNCTCRSKFQEAFKTDVAAAAS